MHFWTLLARMSNRKQAYLFVGDDDYPMGVAARDLVDQLVPPAERAFGLELVEGLAASGDEALASIRRCHEALVTPGFLMMSGKVVWWRSVSFLGDPVLASSEAVKTAMKELASALQEGHAGGATLVMTATGIDKRSAFYKLAAAHFEVREFMLPEKPRQLEQHGRDTILRYLKERGLSITGDALEAMRMRVGADSRQIAAEVEKLALYVGAGRQATLPDVQAVVSRTLTAVMWDLQDAVGERQLVKALDILRDLMAAKESPRGILSALSSRLRELLMYREAMDQGWVRLRSSGSYETGEWAGVPAAAEAALGVAFKRDPRTVHPYVVGKLARQALRTPVETLRENQRILVEAYEDLASSRIPEQTVLELMLLRMMAARRS